MGLVKSGRLRALGVSGAKRSPAIPTLPAIAETPGMEGYDTTAWVGLMAPAGTPRELIDRLSREVRRIIDMPEMRERMIAVGMDPAASTPEEFAEFLGKQQAGYAAIVKAANLKAE